MKHSWILLLMLALLLPACAPRGDSSDPSAPAFELYLLAKDDAHGSEVLNTPLEALSLAEAPLLTTADLLSYDRSIHTLELTEAGMAKVTSLLESGFQVAGIPFVIASGGERLYAGAFWTPLSSQSFDGVVIMDPAFSSEGNTLQISLGYPGSDFFDGTDPRDDARLMDALDDEGVLK